MRIVFRKIGFFTAFIIPALVVAGFCLGGYWNFLAIAFSFIVMPIVDQLAGVDVSNVPEEKVKQVGEDFYYRFVTYVWTFAQIGFVIWGAWVVTTGPLSNGWIWGGFVFSGALVTGGIGITVGT